MKQLITDKTYAEMEAFLTNPDSRIIDSRMLEMYDSFSYVFQVLTKDDGIYQVEVTRSDAESGMKALDLFRLQYRNNPRNSPALYGLLDEPNPELNNGK